MRAQRPTSDRSEQSSHRGNLIRAFRSGLDSQQDVILVFAHFPHEERAAPPFGTSKPVEFLVHAELRRIANLEQTTGTSRAEMSTLERALHLSNGATPSSRPNVHAIGNPRAASPLRSITTSSQTC
jgi:hypothetical protein